MDINFILIVNKSTCKAYTKEAMSYGDLIQTKLSFDKIYLVVSDATNELTVSLTNIWKGSPQLLSLSTWSEYEAAFTEDYLVHEHPIATPHVAADSDGTYVKYVPLAGPKTYVQKTPHLYSATHDSNISVGYGSADNNVRNDIYTARLAPDVIVTSNDDKINLSNCLPVTNGVFSYPIVLNDELFAMHSAKYMKEDRIMDREVSLIDFSELGNMSVHRFKDCGIERYGNNKTLKLTTPESMVGKTIMMVIAGRLIPTDHRYITNTNEIIIPVESIGYRNFLISNTVKSGDNFFNTYGYNVDDVNGYMDFIGSDNDYENFFVFIDNEDILFSETKINQRLGVQGYQFFKDSKGFLINGYDRSLMEYVKIKYDNSELLTTTDPAYFHKIINDNMNSLNRAIANTNIANTRCYKEQHRDIDTFKRGNDYPYYLLEIATV